MDERIDSESTMLAATSFNHILHQIQSSCLNYHIKITPFSAIISIKKSVVKDWEGQPINLGDLPNVDAAINEHKLRQEIDELKTKQQNCFTELSAAYKTVDQLKNVINERDILIKKLQLDQGKLRQTRLKFSYCKSKIMTRATFYQIRLSTQKLGFVLEGLSNIQE